MLRNVGSVWGIVPQHEQGVVEKLHAGVRNSGVGLELDGQITHHRAFFPSFTVKFCVLRSLHIGCFLILLDLTHVPSHGIMNILKRKCSCWSMTNCSEPFLENVPIQILQCSECN